MTIKNIRLLREVASGQLVAVIIALAISLVPGGRFWYILIVSAIMTNSIAGMIHLFHVLLEKKIPVSQKFRSRKILYWGVLILSGSVTGTFIGLSIMSLVFGYKYFPFLEAYFLRFLFFCICIAVIVMTLETVYSNLKEKIEKKVLENEELKRLQMRTQLMALQAKINPHFLFNTLNTMLNLVHKHPQKVETMILNLSDIYRKVLQVPENGRIGLKEEMKMVEEYLEIEKIRLEERLSYSIQMDPGLEDFLIPPLLVEPIVENAVIHGISPRSGGGFIGIEIKKNSAKKEEENRVVIRIEDNGIGMETQKGKLSKGFGLYSVQERLRLIYKDRARFRITPGTGGGTCVIMELPDED